MNDKLQDRVEMINTFLYPDRISVTAVGDNYQVRVTNKNGTHIHSFQELSLLAYLSGMEEVVSMLADDF